MIVQQSYFLKKTRFVAGIYDENLFFCNKSLGNKSIFQFSHQFQKNQISFSYNLPNVDSK